MFLPLSLPPSLHPFLLLYSLPHSLQTPSVPPSSPSCLLSLSFPTFIPPPVLLLPSLIYLLTHSSLYSFTSFLPSSLAFSFCHLSLAQFLLPPPVFLLPSLMTHSQLTLFLPSNLPSLRDVLPFSFPLLLFPSLTPHSLNLSLLPSLPPFNHFFLLSSLPPPILSSSQFSFFFFLFLPSYPLSLLCSLDW